ncbi:MAG: TM2 domain-containing protein [Bacteroidetes bacterium]|nr:TM2 domain-containing protein [Bacteroidota bacterium]
MKNTLFVIFCLLTATLFAKRELVTVYYVDSTQTVIFSENMSLDDKKPNPIFQLFRKKQRLNKRITAAVLAFPFPFGIVGLHRIYLGTKPHVPVAYIASLGGVFGVLPFIDFCAITFGKNFDHYRDNGKVFMWIKE